MEFRRVLFRSGRRRCDETDGSAARRPGGSMTGTTQEGSAITMMRKTLLAGMAAFGLAMTAAPAAMAEDVTYLLPAPPSLPAFGPWMVAQQRGYFKAEGLNVTFQIDKGGVDVAKQGGAGNAVVGGGFGANRSEARRVGKE